MTYRERKERKAERLRGYAETHERRSDEAYEASHAAVERIEPGQPILVGHHSEKRHRRDIARAQSQMSASVEHIKTAERQRQTVDEIERQLATSIYDDDPDAIERLRAKIVLLEAKRDRLKEYNKSARAAARTGGYGDTSLLDERQRQGLESLIAHVAYQLGKGRAMPGYEISSLTTRIREAQKRIVRLEREKEHGPRDRIMASKYERSQCEDCGCELHRGDMIRYNRKQGARCYPECKEQAA